MGLYGWLIGQWEMDAIVHLDDGSQHKGRGEIHFGWVLEGRAIQDVWILPGVFYGTTLRIYDPNIDAWHILWSDPLTAVLYAPDRARARRGHRSGRQERRRRAGALELHRHHAGLFRWLGERSRDGGANWQTQAEFFARRVAAESQTSPEEHVHD